MPQMEIARGWAHDYDNGVLFQKAQSSAKRRFPGLVNFVTALACHFCLALHTLFTQPGDHFLSEPCTGSSKELDRETNTLVWICFATTFISCHITISSSSTFMLGNSLKESASSNNIH